MPRRCELVELRSVVRVAPTLCAVAPLPTRGRLVRATSFVSVYHNENSDAYMPKKDAGRSPAPAESEDSAGGWKTIKGGRAAIADAGSQTPAPALHKICWCGGWSIKSKAVFDYIDPTCPRTPACRRFFGWLAPK